MIPKKQLMRTIKGCFVDTYASTGQLVIPSRCKLLCTYMSGKVSPKVLDISDDADDIPIFKLVVRTDDAVGPCIDTPDKMIPKVRMDLVRKVFCG